MTDVIRHEGGHVVGERREGCPACDAEGAVSAQRQAQAAREARRGPEASSEVVQRAMGGLRYVEAVCSRCRHTMTIDTHEATPADVCRDCSREISQRYGREGEAAQLEEHLPRWLNAYLGRMGMSRRELRAQLDLMPPSLNRALTTSSSPACAVVAGMLEQGEVGEGAFGISCAAGTGKTFALAALVKTAVSVRWQRTVRAVGLKGLTKPFLTWVSWPEAVQTLRVVSTRDGGMQEAEKFVTDLASIPWLFLDDLGAERLRGTYDTDWCASLLDELIDTRYNDCVPTWYTTNLGRPELVERYGARLFSRLSSQNPLIIAPEIKDLRLRW